MSMQGRMACLLLCALLLMGLPPAQARIDPLKRCTMTLSPGMIDYGQLSRVQASTRPLGPGQGPGLARGPGLIRPTGMALPSHTLFLNLVCPQPINLTMLFHAPSRDPSSFDLGGAGFYTLRVHDVRVDEQPVEIGLVTVPGEPPSTIAELLEWVPEHAWVPMRAGMQVPGSRLSAQIDVQAWVTADLTSVRDALAWEAEGIIDAEDARQFVALGLRAQAMPGACTPRLSPSTLDLGTVPRDSLRAEAASALAPRTVQLQLNCNGPTLLAVKLLDNRAGADAVGWAAGLAEPARFALAPREGGVVGVYELSFGAVSNDGQVMQVVQGNGERASNWSAHAEGAPLQRFGAQSAVYAFATPGHGMPAAVDNLSAPLQVEVQLAPASSLESSEETVLDGSVTIEIVYL
ncbi:DUF1120 domain-containing protein [uncultured Stenotrophomonas sp.]|uniref:DUF1120 domain-containing protein n=1 Tax=uncultured Stenotrophomonas sp. TaxID=165438 RepID=UPI0028E27FE1|nr:DUF1120 domain-containing protein [uncultured Stenotrophomonas sp.]